MLPLGVAAMVASAGVRADEVVAVRPPMHIEINHAAGTFDRPDLDQVRRHNTPVHNTVVTRESFGDGIEDVGSVIEDVVGTQIQRFGGLGSFSAVTLRGASSEQVQVYLDGVLLNDAAGGGVNLGDIPLSQIERIEVYRGAVPMELSGSAIGGAVNLVSRGAAAGWSARVKAGAGSFDARELNLSLGHGGERDRVLVAASLMSADNDYPIDNDNGTAFNPDDDFTENRRNADVAQDSLLFNWRRNWRAGGESRVLYQHFARDQGLPNIDNSADSSTRFLTAIDRVHLAYDWDAENVERWSFGAAANVSNKVETYDDRLSQVGLADQYTRSRTEKRGTRLLARRRGDTSSLDLQLSVAEETLATRDLLGRLADTGNRRGERELGIDYTHHFHDDSLIVKLGAKGAWLDDHFGATRDIFDQPVDEREIERTLINPQFGIRYFLDAQSSIKFNYGRYSRAPAFFELFGDRGFFVGNDDLVAEESTNLDLGISYNAYAPGSWFHDSLIEVNLFRRRADDLIVRVFTGQGIGQSQNISDSRVDGLEAFVAIEPIAGIELSWNMTWLDSEVISDAAGFSGNELPGRFAESHLLSVAANAGAWRGKLSARLQRRMFFDSANLLPAADRDLIDLSIARSSADLGFELAINNLTDQRVDDYRGFPRPGREVMFSVVAEF